MTMVEEIFEKKFDDITEKDINWFFDNCIGYLDVEVGSAKALPELPEGWEEFLWQRYTPEDVVRKYKDDAFCRAMGYGCIFFDEINEKLSEYDIIFNTVPFKVLKAEELKQIKSFRDTLLFALTIIKLAI